MAVESALGIEASETHFLDGPDLALSDLRTGEWLKTIVSVF